MKIKMTSASHRTGLKPVPLLRLLLLISLSQFAVTAGAQTFNSTSLPSTVGHFTRAYHSTNVNVASLLALTGGAQNWDFSAGQQGNESIQRTEIVGPDDAGDAASFPDATYAERDTFEPTNQIAWRYYSLTNEGRYYHGSRVTTDQPVSPVSIFFQPTVDIPATVQHGQTWNRTVDWWSVYPGPTVVSNHFTCAATVDAYGTLTLPSIGSMAALRVHETHVYSVYVSSFLLDAYTVQYYYWLVPGLGVAAKVSMIGGGTFGQPATTNIVLRVFASNYFTNQVALGGVAGLQLHIQGTNALLDWQPMTNASAYRVESTVTLENANWQLLGQPATNAWIDPLGGSHKFYRVSGLQ